MSIAEKLTTIAENQQKVYGAGYEKGKAEGGGGSYEEGYEQGKIDGDISKYATSLSFMNAVFPDDYEITISVQNLSTMPSFRGTKGVTKVTLTDVSLDKQYTAYQFLYLSQSIEELVLEDGIRFGSAGLLCNSAGALRRVIGAMDMSGVNADNLWGGCYELEEIRFVPTTIVANVGFQHSSKLSADSIQSIIDGLADLTGQTQQTLTLHNAVGSKLTDAQKAAITAKNWTLAY